MSSDNNCLQVDGYVFNISFDDIPENILQVEANLPWGFSKKEAFLALNPLSGRLLAWKWKDEPDAKWDRWQISYHREITIAGPENFSGLSWDIVKNTEKSLCSIHWFFCSSNSWTKDSTEEVEWEELESKIKITESPQCKILIPEKTWRS